MFLISKQSQHSLLSTLLPLAVSFLLLREESLSARKEYKNSSHGGDKGHSHSNEHHHHHGQQNNTYVNPYYSWDYDNYSRDSYYPAPLPEIRPYEPRNLYTPLYPYDTYPSDPSYPALSILPQLALSADKALLHVGEEIKLTATIKTGVPPYTVYWRESADQEWIAGTTTLSTQAIRTGVITFYAVAKDALGQISLEEKIQVIVLK